MSALFKRKPITELIHQAEGAGPTLRRSLGPWNLIALGIGCIIGAGLFSLTGIVAAENAGPAVVLSFLVAAIGCGFAGMCYSELASMIPVAGSAYTYAYATMGNFIAWIIGWDLVLEYAVGAATLAVSWSSYAVSFMRSLGVTLPVSLTASPFNGGIVNLPAIFIIVAISLLLISGIRQSAAVNGAIVVIKVTVALVVIAVGLAYINPANYHPFIPPNTGTFGEFGWTGIMRGAGVVFFAYIGFDAVSTAAQEAKNPQRDMVIGILGSLAICTVIYIAFSTVLTGIVNYHDMKGDAAPVATAIDHTAYPWLKVMVKLGILAGLTSVMLVLLLGQSRVFYSMARDGFLPALFADIHPKFQTPWRSNLVFMVFTGGLAGFVPISNLGHMTSIGTLLAFVIVCVGVMILRVTHPELPRGYRTPFSPLVPLLGIAVCAGMMAFLDHLTWLRLGIWLLIGLAVYGLYGRAHSLRPRASST